MSARQRGWTAEQLVERFDVSLPPVDVFSIAAHLDVPVVYGNDRRPLLRLVVTPDGAEVRLREGQNAGDARLMVAYALGHLVVGPPGESLPAAALDACRIDDAAARFACALLMPARLFAPYARAFADDPTLLAEHFGVPVAAVERRTAELVVARRRSA